MIFLFRLAKFVYKYKAMQECICNDSRVKGLTQFYATRTGRWAGRLVQVQNLPQNHLDDLDNARDIVKMEDSELMNICYNETLPNILSQLIRTSFIAPGEFSHPLSMYTL